MHQARATQMSLAAGCCANRVPDRVVILDLAFGRLCAAEKL
jgi:hypothetical protein